MMNLKLTFEANYVDGEYCKNIQTPISVFDVSEYDDGMFIGHIKKVGDSGWVFVLDLQKTILLDARTMEYLANQIDSLNETGELVEHD